jgi:2-amino-4-hydroxy-6-hydroxymethyldihydropteridine diphosphokinase
MQPFAERLPVVAYLGLGSNLDDPVAKVKAGRQAIRSLRQVSELKFSSLYRSAPLGPAGQPDYVNAVMAISTTLPPLELMTELHDIETVFGRQRSGERWGPRTLDLDILLYGDLLLESDALRIPHPGIANREFVLYPLAEIAPELEIPGFGRLSELIVTVPRRGLAVIEHA